MRLRQSTAVAISFGPFLDPTDGVTLVTGAVSAIDNGSTGIKLSKNGGALTIRHASVTASTYDAYGNYIVTLDTTDTNTLGTLRVQFAAAATTIPVWIDYEIVNANEWDSSFGTSVRKFTDVDQIKTQAVTAAGAVTVPGTIASATNITAGTITTTTNLTNAPTAGDFTATMKTSLNAATPVVTLAAGAIQAIWDALTSALTTAGSIGKLVVDNLNATISSRMATYTQPTGFLAATFPGTVASTTNITAALLGTTGNNAVADALLGRNVAGGSSTGRTVTQAIQTLRNKQEIAGGVYTLYAVDDTTPIFDAAVTTAAGNPLASWSPSS